jgi:copper homeostasis protein
MSKYTLEICAGDIVSVEAAANGGASRVELCSALAEGGVTPSYGFIKQALKVNGLRVHVLIRPRGGDFIYSHGEAKVMLEDIALCRKLGVHCVVIGALKPSGEIDTALCKQLIRAAGDMDITFHRAFDLCNNPYKALDEIIELGCSRILTSGQAASAEDGINVLSDLVKYAQNRITILAGGGVSPQNAAKILSATGATEIHASARSTIASQMTFKKSGVSMGAPNSDEYSRKTTDANIVKQIVKAINNISIYEK